MRRGQFNFVWLFAIVVGGVILFLAIYGAIKAGDILRYQSDTEAAKSITILTDPLQAGFATGSFGKIIFKQESRVNNYCYEDGGFGKNEISVSQRSDIGKDWNEAGVGIGVYNKYIFSSEKNSGFEYYVFSKPFDFPYEIADLIFLTTEDYCFVGAPDEVVDEVKGLKIPNIETEDCGDDSINVCFGSGVDCDVTVFGSCLSGCDSMYDEGTVVKGGDDMKYVGDLMYGAIFSDREIYECNVKRLLYRGGKIAGIFSEKADLMNVRNCGTNLRGDLVVWESLLEGADSGDLISLRSVSEDMNRKNLGGGCRLW